MPTPNDNARTISEREDVRFGGQVQFAEAIFIFDADDAEADPIALSNVAGALQNGDQAVPVLDEDGKLDLSYLPTVSLISVTTVASEAAQLALDAAEGDIALRTDEADEDGKPLAYIHNGGTEGDMTDWQSLGYEAVTVADVVGLQAELDLKAALTVTDALDTRLDTAETDIGDLQTDVATTADAADLTTLDGRVTTAEGDIAALEAALEIYDIAFERTSVTRSGDEVIFSLLVVRDVTIAANAAGSVCDADAATTDAMVLSIKDDGVEIGTISFGSTDTTGTFATTGGTSKTIAAGSRLEVVGPATADATVDEIALTLAGTTPKL